MFNFEKMLDTYEERKVDRFEDGDLVIDTAAVTDSKDPYETAIKHPSYNEGEWVIVETHSTKEEAIIGHKKWVDTMTSNVLPRKLTDVSNNLPSMLLDKFDDDNWRSNKAEGI